MGIDLSRVATSALQAALEELDDSQQPEPKQRRRRLTAGKAIVAGAAVAVAAKYAVDKTSGLKGKIVKAALRHTTRNALGDLVPESLLDKLMDSGFVNQDDEGVEVKDFFRRSDDDQSYFNEGGASEDRDFFDEPDEEEQSDDRDFFDEPDEEPEDEEFFDDSEEESEEGPEDNEVDEPEDDVDEDDEPRDEGGAQRAADAAPANGRADKSGVVDALSRSPRRRRRSRKVDPAE